MTSVISIGPVSSNNNSSMKLTFGCNVSADKVIHFVRRNTEMREECGLINKEEAASMVKETEEKVRVMIKQ